MRPSFLPRCYTGHNVSGSTVTFEALKLPHNIKARLSMLWAITVLISRAILTPALYIMQTISQKIQPQHERGDCQARKQRHPRKHLRHGAGLVDHTAPIRGRRRQTEAEKAEHANRDDHVAEA